MPFVMRAYCFSLCKAWLDGGYCADDPHLIEPFYYVGNLNSLVLVVSSGF
jgi:hypothetical protein